MHEHGARPAVLDRLPGIPETLLWAAGGGVSPLDFARRRLSSYLVSRVHRTRVEREPPSPERRATGDEPRPEYPGTCESQVARLGRSRDVATPHLRRSGESPVGAMHCAYDRYLRIAGSAFAVSASDWAGGTGSRHGTFSGIRARRGLGWGVVCRTGSEVADRVGQGPAMSDETPDTKGRRLEAVGRRGSRGRRISPRLRSAQA